LPESRKTDKDEIFIPISEYYGPRAVTEIMRVITDRAAVEKYEQIGSITIIVSPPRKGKDRNMLLEGNKKRLVTSYYLLLENKSEPLAELKNPKPYTHYF
jgi:hypothetical protein